MTEPVPTSRDLVRMGPEYAEALGWTKAGDPTEIRIHPKGHALLGDIMRRNAAQAVANGEGDWYPEAPHRRPKGTS